jgi:hypothetical protein
MEKRLFFNGIHMTSDHFSVVEAEESSPSVFSDMANTPGAVLDDAPMIAKKTANPQVLLLLIKMGLFHFSLPPIVAPLTTTPPAFLR